MDKKIIEQSIESQRSLFEQVSDSIWEFAEFKFQEYRSSKLQKDTMAELGFRITDNLAGMETAFVAEIGHGKPVIAFLGEFDALRGMSQEADKTEKCPIPGQEFGHGCGHNLLGVGSMAAAYGAAQYLKEKGLEGTVRYYGCPAEEGGCGKVYMVRAGCFEDVDAAFTWHTGSVPGLFNSTLANTGLTATFHGVTAHSAAAPQVGRSAYDAVELANHACCMMRGRIVPGARVDYAVNDAGGTPANIIPGQASARYSLRAPSQEALADMFDRLVNILKGAALMSGTTVEMTQSSAYVDFLPNDEMDDIMLESLDTFVPVDYSEEELEVARKYKEIGPGKNKAGLVANVVDRNRRAPAGASTDASDVSWNVPTGQIVCATYPIGTPLHNWQATAQGKSALAHRGMLTAGKVMAAGAAELFENPERLERAKQLHAANLAGKKYRSVLPMDAQPGKPSKIVM